MKRKTHRIVIVGGGSNMWAPNIVKDMLLTESIAGSEFVLYDVDKPAAELVAAFLRKLDGRLGTSSTFVATDDRRRAFEGARAFVITISTGGLKSMGRDIAIPEEYGVYHTVGDTCGQAAGPGLSGTFPSSWTWPGTSIVTLRAPWC
jgi:alpha-galactosidase